MVVELIYQCPPRENYPFICVQMGYFGRRTPNCIFRVFKVSGCIFKYLLFVEIFSIMIFFLSVFDVARRLYVALVRTT